MSGLVGYRSAPKCLRAKLHTGERCLFRRHRTVAIRKKPARNSPHYPAREDPKPRADDGQHRVAAGRERRRPGRAVDRVRAGHGQRHVLPNQARRGLAWRLAVSWGPNRLDVFGVGTDATMHHRSYAGGWDAGWTSLSGQFTSPPAVVARGPNKLDVFGLGGDYAMYHASGDGKSFAQWDRQGGEFETPGTYRFSLDSFEILDTRSVHNDTDSIAVSITVGGQPPQTLTMKTGDVNNGTHNVGLAFAPVNVDLSDFVIFNYLILNSGHADQKAIDDQLTGVAKTLSAKGVQAATEAIGKGLASLVGAVIGNASLLAVVVVVTRSACHATTAGWLVNVPPSDSHGDQPAAVHER
jgi:hypothetical protein